MKRNYSLNSLKIVMLFLVICISPQILLRAQSIANYSFSTSTSGTLEDLSLGSTSILTGNQDDAATAVFPIGFNFQYMGVSYSHFSANSNGQFQFHTSAGASAIGANVTPSAGVPNLFPMTGDNEVNNGMRYIVLGTAPNRKFVLEWNQFYVNWTNLINAGNMQLWLDEATGKIDFIYGEIYNSSSSSVTKSIGIATGTTATTQGSVAVLASPTYSASATLTVNTFAAGSGTTTGSPLIANLGTNVPGTRRVYTFTPATVNAPSLLTFSGITATGMTLNWSDNATNELGYKVYKSLDGITYTLAGQIAANSTTYVGNGLSPNTLYYWKVIAYAEIESSALIGNQSTNPTSLAAGIYTVGTGGTYDNLTIAFADINAQGLTGNVELQLIAGYPATPETYPILSCGANSTGPYSVKVYPTVSGLSITSANATGTLNLNGATNLTFDGRINQAGSKDLVISNTNAGASYAIQYVNDAKSNTLQYLTILSANNSTSSGTIVFAGSTGTTGNDNNTIDNCDIKDGASTPLNAIYSAGTSTAIDNSGNIVSNSNIFNYFGAGAASNGVLLASNSSTWTINANKFYQTATRTLTSGAQHRAINVITSSGNGYVITNNVIGYASSSATGVTNYTASAGRFFGIELTSANTGTASSIQGNTISGISFTTTSGTTAAPGIFAGISILGGTVSVGTTSPNIIGATTGNGAISITTSNTANAFGIHANSTGTLDIVNNVIGAINATGSTAGSTCGIVGINTTGATTATTITGNTIGGATANSIASGTSAFTTTAGTVSGIATANNTTLLTISGNTVNNISNNSSSTTAALNGIVSVNAPVTSMISNNTVSNTSLVAGTLTNISSTNPGTLTVSGNNIFNSSSTNAAATINGITINNGTTSSFFKNKIYNLTASGTGSSVNGILASGGTTVTIYNNVIGDLKTPTTSSADAIRGISITSTSTSSSYRVYYNSVYLNASSSGTNFGSSGIYHTVDATATTAALDLRNNLIINESTPAGTGISVAYRRSGTALGNYSSASNRNMFYAGIPSATHLLMYDGTTSYQTMTAYQTAVLPRDANSFTGEALFIGAGYSTPGNFFISTTPSNANYLKPVVGIATQVESGAANITTPLITDDYSSVIRQGNAGYTGTGTSPDLGAFEFEGVNSTPVITLNSVTPPTTAQCVATARLVSVNITTGGGTITGATIGYAINGVPQSNILMTNVSGSTWEGTIPVPTPANATITWGVAAVSSIGINGSYTGTSYSDEPLTGVIASASASVTTTCAGSPSVLTANIIKTGASQIGSGTGSNASNTAVGAFYGSYWGNGHAQILITSAELTAAGFKAGNITALSVNITALGSPTTLNNFTVKMAPTAATTITTFQAPTFTTVVNPANYTPVLGTNTHTFNTAFAWNGTSNIIVDYCFANSVTGSTSAINTITTTAFGSFVNYNADGATGAGACSNTTVSNTSSNRPNLTFTGNKAPSIQSVSWSDGATVVGTTNPLTVNPITTATMTATITAAGCVVTPAPSVLVTVNPLPTAPTATNSAQCGVQIPTASVTSTSGLPTPSFNWYAAASGGSALQASTSTTYTSTVATTTTFYVSELNSATGCESVRTPLTVNVSTPDAIAAAISDATICLGETVTLTASNTNPSAFQSYTYSWISTTGSGNETTTAGSSIMVTPTIAGTYTYNLTGVDGGCSAVASVNVTVSSLPVITSAIASPSPVCSDSPITLTGTSNGTTNTTFNLGSGTLSGNADYYTPFYHNFGGHKSQFIVLASELTAMGYNSGNFTSLGMDITSAGTTWTGFTMYLGTTSNTNLSAGFVSLASLTQVYNNPLLSLTANTVNNFPISGGFVWDGVSNIIIQFSWSNNNSGDLANSAGVKYNTTSFVSHAYYRQDNASVSTILNAATSSGTLSNRPKFVFTGSVQTNIASSLTWNWTPGTSLNTPVATTSITNNTGSPITQAFTVTVTDPVTGCIATATTNTVTINPAPVAPTATNSTQCGPHIPTASVTGSGIPGNTFNWYTLATGGTAITGETANMLTALNVSATTTFYVSETNGTCESPRVPVTVTVTTPPAIVINGDAAICNGTAASLVASSSNDPNYSYTWSNGLGSVASVSASPTATTTYTVTASDLSGGANNGCLTSGIFTVTVNANPIITSTSASSASICAGNSVNLSTVATSNSFVSTTDNIGFETFPPTGWTMQNAGTGNSWTQNNAFFHSGANAMRYSYNSTNAANAWAITSGYNLLAGQSVSISFWYLATDVDYPEKLKLTSGTGATAASQTNILWNNNNIIASATPTWVQVTQTFTAPSNGTFYFGLNCYSDADMFRLYIDDVQIISPQPVAPTYAWTSTPAGFTSAVQNPTGVTPSVTTNYTVTVSNNLGCSVSGSTTVIVNHPSTSSTPITACDSYTWNGTTYNASGAYTWTGTNAVGCDSVATLNLTIKNSSTSSTPITACDSYTWNGTTYNSSGTYTYTTTNAVGCDSIASLVLTINNSTTSSTPVNACVTYTWNGTTYNSSGTYTFTTTNSVGCDSLATLVLTIGQPSTSSSTVTECDSYTWNGTTYNGSGTYTWSTLNAAGCDSTATLILTINNSTTSSETATECDSYTWNGATYTTSGTYTYTTSNAVGCDSIVTLVLTINNSTTSSTSVSACDSYTWNGTTYNASGTYTFATTNAAGCDSTATLVLTINEANAVVTNNSGVFNSNAATSYKWINCATNAVIAGETSQTFTPTVNGSYAVIITNANGCIDTSACVTINNVGIKELADNSLNVYPNPTTGKVTIEFSAASASVEVVDAQGKLMFTQSVVSGDIISLESYDRGVYFLKINSENGSSLQRVVKN